MATSDDLTRLAERLEATRDRTQRQIEECAITGACPWCLQRRADIELLNETTAALREAAGSRERATDGVEAFYARVNARAEADMLNGRPITGAHHRALEAEISAYRDAPTAPASAAPGFTREQVELRADLYRAEDPDTARMLDALARTLPASAGEETLPDPILLDADHVPALTSHDAYSTGLGVCMCEACILLRQQVKRARASERSEP